jgi:large subunit ribosomal protein L17
MYKRNGIKKLGKKTSHRHLMVKNQLRSLFTSGHIKTTSAKAKYMRGQAQSLISKVQNTPEDNLVLRRNLQVILGDDELVKKVYAYCKKDGVGVTLRKVGFRAGDMTEVSRLELLNFKTKKRVAKKNEKEEKVEEKKVVKKSKVEAKQVIDKKVSNRPIPVKKERAKTRSGL